MGCGRSYLKRVFELFSQISKAFTSALSTALLCYLTNFWLHLKGQYNFLEFRCFFLTNLLMIHYIFHSSGVTERELHT